MFDELNYFEYDQEEIEEELKKYFREMPDITEEQVEERKDVALDVFFLMLFFMGMVKATDEAKQYQDLDYYIEMLGRRYEDIVDKYAQNNSPSSNINYVYERATQVSREIVNKTFENIDNNYYLSSERALNIAENEANIIENSKEFDEAIKRGDNAKIWVCKRDGKERKTHKEALGQKKKINEYFIVGGSEFLFPKDLSHDPAPKEYIGCRCNAKFFYDKNIDTDKEEIRAQKNDEFRKEWATYNFEEILAKFGLTDVEPYVSDSTQKLIYTKEGCPVELVYDYDEKYFRVQKAGTTGKKLSDYLDINGEPLNLEEINGKGNPNNVTRDDKKRLTHFNDGEYYGT